ncbi:MAG TPA: hypothetical protein H9879_05470 [Candidatus Alistipes intestinipullorum]|nr:hypothetical protein [Candidatus Alistipes intestinipullorum]
MTPLHIRPLPDSTPDVIQKIDALNHKLGSFIHAPLNLKEVLRMEPFAADAEVVQAVAATLDDYAILPTSPTERECQRTTGLPKDYDIVGFWYCVALLALSAESAAVRYLLVLARMLMAEDPAELFLLRRTVRLLDGFPFPHLQELRSRIEAFYDTVTHKLEAFRWLEAAGIPWPEAYEWEVITQFSSDGESYADPAAPKEERRRRVVLTLRLNSPRSLYGSCRQHNSYEISLRNDDNTTRGLWNEGHGDLFIEDRPVMQHRMFTPLQLPELFDALEKFGIRLVRKPVMVYTSQKIRNAHVKVWRMLEDQLGHKPSEVGQAAEEAPDQPKAEDDADGTSAGRGKSLEVERAVEGALDLLKYDGDVNDSLAEMRKKWGGEISALHDARFDEIGVQYACRSHEEGLAAVGQELTCFGYRLYDLDGDDVYLLTLQPETHATDFEKACREAGQYCRLLKQSGRAPGTPARAITPEREMPCEEVPWPDDADYMLDSLAGDFCSGRWKSRDAEEWQGNFVVDLRQRPLQPVKVRWNRFCCLTYSPEMDFYAAFYYIPPMQCWMLLGGKDPLAANRWKRLCDLPKQESPFLFLDQRPRWFGRYLCFGDRQSATILTMNPQGVERVQRFPLPKAQHPCKFACDGLGRILLAHGEETYRYDNGTLTPLGFHLSSGDGFNGSIPVPGTGRLVMCGFSDRELVARLLELDVDTRRCRASRLQNMDPWSGLLPFGGDWVLLKGACDSMRLDFARLWNRTTGEVLRIRPGMFGSEKLEHIGLLSDGRVVLTTLRSDVGQVVHFPTDFWTFLRTASRLQFLEPMRPCEGLYPDIPLALPEETQQS